MKPQYLILSAALVVTLTACGEKNDVASKATAVSQEVTQKVQEAAQQATTELAKQVQEPAKKAVTESVKAVKEVAVSVEAGAKKSAAVVKTETEQALASTVEHAQAVTKSQESKSRSRAQKAEDEMMELDKKK
jgi:allophanate hydrolase subunit 1